MISTTSIRCAVAVAEAGSFRQAGRTLNLTQSAVSKQVALLERQLGVLLFDRTRSGAAVSTEGRSLLPHLHTAVNSLDSVLREAGRLKTSTLTIASHRIGLISVLPPLMRIVSAHFDGIQMETIHVQEQRALEMLRLRQIDMALGFRAPRSEPPPDVEEVSLVHSPVVVAVARNHPLAGRSSVSPDDLAGQTIINVASPLADRLVKYFFDNPASVRWMTTTDTQVGLAMVKEEVGVMVTIQHAMPLGSDEVAMVPWGPGGALVLTLLRRRGEKMSGAPRLVWELLTAGTH